MDRFCENCGLIDDTDGTVAPVDVTIDLPTLRSWKVNLCARCSGVLGDQIAMMCRAMRKSRHQPMGQADALCSPRPIDLAHRRP